VNLLSSIGKEVAAEEILVFVQKKIKENENKPEVVKVLREIEEKAESVRSKGEGGY
jgi:hypothetical protein